MTKSRYLVDALLLLQPQSRRGRPVGAAPEDRPADGARALPPARRPRVAHHVAQEVMLAPHAAAAPAVRGPAGVAARVALPVLPVLLLLPSAAALATVVEAVDGEKGDGAEERAGEAEVVPGLGLGQVEVADDGQAEEEGERAGALGADSMGLKNHPKIGPKNRLGYRCYLIASLNNCPENSPKNCL